MSNNSSRRQPPASAAAPYRLIRSEADLPDDLPLYDRAMVTEITAREIIERYLKWSKVNGVHGDEAYAESVRLLHAFAAVQIEGGRSVGECNVAELMPYHLSDWIEGNPKWTTSSTRRGKANRVNACFNWALKQRRITENPFAGVDYEESPPRPRMREDLFDVLAADASQQFGEAMEFLRGTGCRISDLMRLDWPGIDFETMVATVWIHKTVKKTKKPKCFSIAGALELLRKIRARALSSAGLTDPRLLQGPVFLNTAGSRWTKETLGQTVRRIKKRRGLTDAPTLHGIRHQFGTEAVKRGLPIKLVSQQLGHASVVTTEKYYVHTQAEDLHEIAAIAGRRDKVDGPGAKGEQAKPGGVGNPAAPAGAADAGPPPGDA